MDPISFNTDYAPRKAFAQVRGQVAAALAKNGAAYGEPFFSEAELMRMAGVSRTTVRKALDLLASEGWIERRPGKGTFVGARARIPPAAGPDAPFRGAALRVAVVLHNLDSPQPDWFSRGVLGAMDELAAKGGVTIEVIGNPQPCADVRQVTRRLAQSRPAAVVVLPASSSHALLAGAVTAMGIPCFVCGAHCVYTGLPTVCEDGAQGMRLAMAHLVRRRGRKRVGLLLATLGADWVQDRLKAYFKACAEFRAARDGGLVLWTPFINLLSRPRELLEHNAVFRDYLRRNQPDALVLGCSGQHWKTLRHAVKRRWLDIPGGVDVVAFDQNYAEQEFYLGRRLPTIEIPLLAQCRAILQMVRQVEAGAPFDGLPRMTRLPCRLVEPRGWGDARVQTRGLSGGGD